MWYFMVNKSWPYLPLPTWFILGGFMKHTFRPYLRSDSFYTITMKISKQYGVARSSRLSLHRSQRHPDQSSSNTNTHIVSPPSFFVQETVCLYLVDTDIDSPAPLVKHERWSECTIINNQDWQWEKGPLVVSQSVWQSRCQKFDPHQGNISCILWPLPLKPVGQSATEVTGTSTLAQYWLAGQC